MKTILVFKLDPDGRPEARQIQMVVNDSPRELKVGDKFHLSVFRGIGKATIIRLYFDDEKDFVIECIVSLSLFLELFEQAKNVPGTMHYYEIPEQRWA